MLQCAADVAEDCGWVPQFHWVATEGLKKMVAGAVVRVAAGRGVGSKIRWVK